MAELSKFANGGKPQPSAMVSSLPFHQPDFNRRFWPNKDGKMVVSAIFKIFLSLFGEDCDILTSIFELAWNHQLEKKYSKHLNHRKFLFFFGGA